MTNGNFNGDFSALTFGEKITVIATLAVITPAMLFGGLMIMGIFFDGIATHYGDRDECRNKATTPREFHEC